MEMYSMSEVDNAAPIEEQIEPGALVEDEIQEATPTSPEDGTETPVVPKAKGVQRRLDELTAQRREAVEREQRAVREAEHWRQLALQGQQKPESTTVETEPVLENFQDYGQYTKAVARWEIRQEMQAEQQRQQQQAAQYQEQQRVQSFTQRINSFEASVPDFRETVGNPNLSISNYVVEAVQSFDGGPAVLYYLGKNPEESRRISSLDRISAAVEIGRLSALVSQKPNRQTSAPPPIEPLGGGGNAAVDQDKMTADQWRIWRNAQLYNKGK
jgi:hypothetical protein